MAFPEKRESVSSEAFKQQFEAMIKLQRTIIICEVVEFDSARNTVDVQPVNMTKLSVDKEPELAPILNHIPVHYFGAADLWLTIEPEPGDHCIVMVSDRSIDNWKNEGAIISPDTTRHHDATDGIAIFGLNPYPKAIEAIESKTIHLRTRDGSAGVRVMQDMVESYIGPSHVTLTAGDITIETPSTIVKMDGSKIEAEAASEIDLTVSSDSVNIKSGIVTVKSIATVLVDAPVTEMTGELIVAGNVIAGGDVTAGDISLQQHVHGGVETGAGVTGQPE